MGLGFWKGRRGFRLQAERSQQGHESPIGPQVVKTRVYAYEGDARRVLLDRRGEQIKRLFLIAHPYLTDRQVVGGNKSTLSRRP